MSRRSIIGIVAVAVAGLVGVTVYAVVAGDDDRRAGAFRTYTATGNWVVELNGQTPRGRLLSVDGCRPKGKVAVIKQVDQQGKPLVTKQLSGVGFEPCELRFDTGTTNLLFNWMNATLDRSSQRKDVTLWE